MTLTLLDFLSKSASAQRVQESVKTTPKKDKSLLSEIGEQLENAAHSRVELEEQHVHVHEPHNLAFFGIDTDSPEHFDMENEFKSLKKSNPRLCNKILQLD